MRNVLCACLITLTVFSLGGSGKAASGDHDQIKVVRFGSASATVSVDGKTTELRIGERAGKWTLMAVVERPAGRPFAVLEDFSSRTGHLLIVDAQGVQVDLPKSQEPTSADAAKVYRGHTLEQVLESPSDLLGDEILAKGADPDYDEVAEALPPIRKMQTYTFVGTPETVDKIGFEYGGRTPSFDPAPYDVAIAKIRERGGVWDGLVGGHLPVLRFVYPEGADAWTEMIAFAPERISNENDRIQPAWYRVVHVEGGSVKWARYVDSYHPFPPRTEYDPKIFYRDLAELNDAWERALAPGMRIHVPDERVENMARFAIVRDMMTRVGDYPKYGVVDRNYAGSEHDGFPDTFTVDTAAMLEWGYVELAGRYIDNYFGKFVRDDGSLLYRGPETGQYGRMLTVVAQFANYGGDKEILLKRRSRIDGVTKLLLGLRAKAKTLPADSAAFGMLAGWSEADACLDPMPARYMQPYFSNSTEAARGFRDLGRVWERIGGETKNPELTAWGRRLVQESEELETDIQRAITRSLLKLDGETVLPAIAGVTEPFHVAVPKDSGDPQFRSYRAYMEMMYSGILTKEQVEWIAKYRRAHYDTILGVPTAYGYKTGELAGFLSYGHGYGLIQNDDLREALLLVYSVMAHQNTRGTWTAPETRSIKGENNAAPYCTPAQLVVALMTRWMMVFEDPMSETLWLGKALPRKWLEDGKTVSIEGTPTRWGKVGFEMRAHAGQVMTTVTLPKKGLAAEIKLRLRVPGDRKMKSVTVNGKSWTDFDAAGELVTIRQGMAGSVKVVAEY